MSNPVQELRKPHAPETEVRLSRVAEKWERYAQAMFCYADDHSRHAERAGPKSWDSAYSA